MHQTHNFGHGTSVSCRLSQALKRQSNGFDRHAFRDEGHYYRLRVPYLCKAGDLENAMALFSRASGDHVLIWNAIIQAHCKKKLGYEGLWLFQKMLQECVMPNKVTFACLLSLCGTSASLIQGKHFHARIIHSKFGSDIFVTTSVINMYGKCGLIKDATQAFTSLEDCDAVAFNALMTSFLVHNMHKDTIQSFEQMQQEGVIPIRSSYIAALEACGAMKILSQGKHVHISSSFNECCESNVALGNAVMNMYGKCGDIYNAEELFWQMQLRDVISWNTIMSVYGNHGNSQMLLLLFKSMLEKGTAPDQCTYVTLVSAFSYLTDVVDGMYIHSCIVNDGIDSDVILGTALINMYGMCGSVEDAKSVFDKVQEKNVFTWNTIITVLIQHFHENEALFLFNHMMNEGRHADKVTFVNALAAAASAVKIDQGTHISLHLHKLGMQSDVAIGSALVNMYGKFGMVEDAEAVFSQISDTNMPSWNAMMTVYSQHGECRRIFQLFKQMWTKDIVPDRVTCISFLTGCSHSGFVGEGLRFFMNMYLIHDVIPDIDHYGCLIDLLAKAGRLEKAIGVTIYMPLQPNDISRTALISNNNFDNVFDHYM